MAVFGSLVGQVLALPLTWRGTDPRRVAPFILGGLIGVPLGIYLLGALDPNGFKLGLGVFLVLYSPLGLFTPAHTQLSWGGKWADAAAGWIGGVFGGLGGFAGSIPTLWCTQRGWDKDTLRGTMQAFNISMHIATLTGYAIEGNKITGETLKMFAIIAPALAIPVLIGAMIFRRLNQLAFRRIVLVLLFASGMVLTVSTISAMMS